MRRRSQWACLAGILLGLLPLQARAQDDNYSPPIVPTNRSTRNTSADPELRRDMFVSLDVVKESFPEVSRYSLQPHANAAGNLVASGMVDYATKDGAQKVRLSVDQYQNAAESLVAYQDASQKSQAAESNPIAISNVGQQVFAYTMPQGSGTSVAITSLDGGLIIGAILNGYEATTDNIAKLADLTRKEVAQAHAHLTTRRKR